MFKSVLNTFFPKVCVGCGEVLSRNERVVCTSCLHKLPLIGKQENAEALIQQYFYGRLPIAHAAGLLFYKKKELSQKLLHHLKYKGREEISEFLGNWLAGRLADYEWVKTIDWVIPVPLHKKRKKKRGYNQVSGFASALALHFGCQYSEDILIKTFNSRTQVFKNRFYRTELKGAYFALQHPEKIEGRHVLLVDDIITTGATLETCARSLLKAKPAKISLVTMAVNA